MTFLATGILFVLLFVQQHASQILPQILLMLPFAFELFWPIFWLGQKKKEPVTYKLGLPRNKKQWADDSRRLLAYSLVFLTPSAGFFYLLNNSQGLQGSPEIWFSALATQIFFVALPEEVFYRGFLLAELKKRWPKIRKLGPFSLGPAILISSAVFAAAHLVGTLHPLSLLTFFPGLLFANLATKSNSLLSAILFHALCNTLVAMF